MCRGNRTTKDAQKTDHGCFHGIRLQWWVARLLSLSSNHPWRGMIDASVSCGDNRDVYLGVAEDTHLGQKTQLHRDWIHSDGSTYHHRELLDGGALPVGTGLPVHVMTLIWDNDRPDNESFRTDRAVNVRSISVQL